MSPQLGKPCLGPERLVGIVLVLALHGAVLWGLVSHRLIGLPTHVPTLIVDLIAPPAQQAPRPVAATPAPAAPRLTDPVRPSPVQTAIATPDAGAQPVTIATPAAPPVAVAPAPTPVLPAGPFKLAGELAVSCPERSAPDYPLVSRRRNETGTTLLHVELDEAGRIAAASIAGSSGSPRLDEAALAAVRRWRCNPPQRDGRAVRATARQAFNFVLQGS